MATDKDFVLMKLVQCCQEGNVPGVSEIVTTNHITTDDLFTDFDNALFWACWANSKDVVNYLCTTFSLRVSDIRRDENRILRYCCAHGLLNLIRYFYERYDELVLEDAYPENFRYTEDYNKSKCKEWIINHKAGVNVKNNKAQCKKKKTKDKKKKKKMKKNLAINTRVL